MIADGDVYVLSHDMNYILRHDIHDKQLNTHTHTHTHIPGDLAENSGL